jgi:hypothetical protein
VGATNAGGKGSEPRETRPAQAKRSKVGRRLTQLNTAAGRIEKAECILDLGEHDRPGVRILGAKQRQEGVVRGRLFLWPEKADRGG